MAPLPLFDGRHCVSCLQWKPFDDFHRDKKSPYGRRTTCKVCVKAYQQELHANPRPRKPASRDEKYCPSCSQTKPGSEFRSRKGGKYLSSHCRSCETEQARQRYWKHRDRARLANRRTTLRRYYNMTPADYDALLLSQGGVCAICEAPEPQNHRLSHLCVDHDHGTGAVRGLLCNTCNRAVGFIRDNPDRAKRMMDYLQHHSDRDMDEVLHFGARTPVRNDPPSRGIS